MPKHAFTLYLPEETLRRLRVAAAMTNKSITGMVEEIVVAWLKKNAEAIDTARRAIEKANKALRTGDD